MLRLITHIERLLLAQDCVLVPGLGGFVLQVVNAAYNAEEEVFVPMQKEVVFNTTLQHNDGLLSESYMQTYGVDYVSEQCSMKSKLLEDLLDADELSYAYLERKGYLPTAEVGIDGDGYGVTASLSNILSPNLKEGFSGAYVDVYAIGGETRRYEMEQGDNEREYSLFIPQDDLPEDLGYGYLADFFLIGETSGNEYTFDSIGWKNNETI